MPGLGMVEETHRQRTLAPFAEMSGAPMPRDPSRRPLGAAYRSPEPDCLAPLLAEAVLPSEIDTKARQLGATLCRTLRDQGPVGGVQGLIGEFDLSSPGGVALMRLAEALLRIPDPATRDLLIAEKLSGQDWRRHLGGGRALFVRTAAAGLVLGGALARLSGRDGLAGALGILSRPLLRKAMALGMQLMGHQFVAGRTIHHALAHARKTEAKGFRYSYDLLGETAMTARDTDRYMRGYEDAIAAIGQAAAGRGLYDGPGISIKLSALHPRYCRAQRDRVMAELYPRLRDLAILARGQDIGITIDAEEADRLDLSLDLMGRLARDPRLKGWDGLGMVVQAYQKRAPHVIDHLIALGRDSGHRLMIRLCKGAYWDSEIKRAQLDGLIDFPVYTRKVHTDVSYLACARRLLSAPDAIFPQFATHNALTMAAIHALAGEPFAVGRYEFQGLHGMGEALYSQVVGPDHLDRPCRLYAPVGTPETLLAYLVRRLLENGANSSFVNRIGDPDVPLEDLLVPPATLAARVQPVGSPHEQVTPPLRLFGPARLNSAGIDWSDETVLERLGEALRRASAAPAAAVPLLAGGPVSGTARIVDNPADRSQTVGTVVEATAADVDAAIAFAAASAWGACPAERRAACLATAADLMEGETAALLALLVREAGKTLPNAIAELREAVDFLRYYGRQVTDGATQATVPLGPVVCISPWNFPLAIFSGQIAAALAAGNPVLAKPAEETPLVAALAVSLFHRAGVPADALQLLTGDGAVGARAVADPRVQGVMFTGSIEVARLIQGHLAGRLGAGGRPVPLIAETGGQNAMVVDSSALPEQVVADVLQSAFDSAGQRCSALRLLCLQDEIADKVLAILTGAMAELSIGSPDRLSTDVGPVISEPAAQRIRDHVAAMSAAGHRVLALSLPAHCQGGTFVAPTVVEIPTVSALRTEVFGPVLHVLRFRRQDLDGLIDALNATGYGLTFGIHSRVETTIGRLSRRIRAGNIYVNRNMIGAVVGLQPFGGHGLSGTGPKAGGPLYLRRLLAVSPSLWPLPAGERAATGEPAAVALAAWLEGRGRSDLADPLRAMIAASPVGYRAEFPGPVGETNHYEIIARGRVLCLAGSEDSLLGQLGAALAAGNRAVVPETPAIAALLRDLPGGVRAKIEAVPDGIADPDIQAVLCDAGGGTLCRLAADLAARPGAIVPIILPAATGYALLDLVTERSISINTAASGNTSLVGIG